MTNKTAILILAALSAACLALMLYYAEVNIETNTTNFGTTSSSTTTIKGNAGALIIALGIVAGSAIIGITALLKKGKNN